MKSLFLTVLLIIAGLAKAARATNHSYLDALIVVENRTYVTCEVRPRNISPHLHPAPQHAPRRPTLLDIRVIPAPAPYLSRVRPCLLPAAQPAAQSSYENEDLVHHCAARELQSPAKSIRLFGPPIRLTRGAWGTMPLAQARCAPAAQRNMVNSL